MSWQITFFQFHCWFEESPSPASLFWPPTYRVLSQVSQPAHSYLFLVFYKSQNAKMFGGWKQLKMAISQCSKNLLLGAPTDHCRGQAPHCLTTTKKGREGRERARECELGFHDLEKRTWWNMRIENFTTSGLQTRHVNLPKGWVGKDSTPYKKKRIWWNMRIGNSTTSGPHVPQKNTSFHSTFSSANKHFMFHAS